LDFYVSVIHPLDHAEYYPGATAVHIKLIIEKKNGRILGAQIVGTHGVDKRIDVIATAIMAGMRVEDLEHLDLAYAPQFSSAKDPVVMAGFVASNTLRGETQTITCEELKSRLDRGDAIQLVDVRTRKEYEQGKIPGAQLIPVDELRDRLHELDPQAETVVYCKVGLRGYLATRILLQLGFNKVQNLTGGFILCKDRD
jgi:rhodanese-related sulfurtransferase